MVAFFPTREIAVAVGPLAIHWYGIMYLIAFMLAWFVTPILSSRRGVALSSEQMSSLLSYGIAGTIIGGRLGFVLFHSFAYFIDHPLEIVMLWNGGMSSHGGFIGVALSLYYFSRREGIPFLKLVDILIVPAAIGLALGRFGNFINGELFGMVTTLPWGIHISGIDGLRHPTQIYAMFKDLCIALVCFVLLKRWHEPGSTTGVFLILYGTLRFLIEYVREPTSPLLSIFVFHLSRGQILTIPLVFAGACLIVNALRKA